MKLIKIFKNVVLFNTEDFSDDDFYYLVKLIFVIPLLVLTIIICILLIYFTTAMSKVPNSVSTSHDNNVSSRFTRIESSALRDSYDVVYDNETKVMYTVSYKGEFTVLLNADGTPLLYEGE